MREWERGGCKTRDRNPTIVQHVYVSRAALTFAIYANYNPPPPPLKLEIFTIPLSLSLSSSFKPRIYQRGFSLQVHNRASRVLTFNYAIYMSALTKSLTILRGCEGRCRRWMLFENSLILRTIYTLITFKSQKSLSLSTLFGSVIHIARHLRGDDAVINTFSLLKKNSVTFFNFSIIF